MRIDARKDSWAAFWSVFHVPTAKQLKNVVWADDETHEWCQYLQSSALICGQVQTETHRARRIEFHESRKLVLIDPIDDEAQDKAAVDTAPVPERAAA